ncbi:hypothetical protein [Leisingera caerulea]|uniref:hypothetical protein n=1 Tax=Leisingera caerulea TaxID=506591 RepID=UPI0021A52E71|nr:hypothetical protein [Leisingera caerulea]UWQ82930.1 hypothetical protein K3726_14810 [Leisingera caerulea]
MRTTFLTSLAVLGLLQAASAEEENRCGVPSSQDTDDLCEGLTHFLPHFADDFNLSQLDGRYALACGMSEGIELYSMSADKETMVHVDGLEATGVFRPNAYFGSLSVPLSFILPISYTDPHSGEERTFSVNGDHQGFYILEDWDGVRRLSKCSEDAK